jgi:apolipoprotein N-acyltransferase
MTKIASGRVSPAERPYFAEKLARLHEWFLEGSRREARAGARLVAWPEQNLLVFAEDEPTFLARAQRLAADEHLYLVMGLGTVYAGTPLPFENKSVVIDPSGRILVSYLKSHPVAGWEASVMRRGDGRLPIVDAGEGRLATAICFDADFPEFMRQAGRGGADLLVVPANEWREIKDVHMQMAAFRAIENGVSLVRPAASGLSSAVDPWGRVLGIADDFSARDRTMTAHVPIAHISTLYAKTGDLFAWLCVVGLVVAIGMAAMAPASLSLHSPRFRGALTQFLHSRSNRLLPRSRTHINEYLSRKKCERLGHEVRVELEHTAVPRIGIDDEVAMRKTARQIVRVLGWNHTIAIAVCNKHRLLNL